MRLGAIDIGSNAVRLLIADANVSKKRGLYFKKVKLYRLPVRLGADAFTTGIASPHTIEKLTQSMQAFRTIMDVYDVQAHKVYATSAMRETKNSREVIDKVWQGSGIKIEIIDGDVEAKVIVASSLKEHNWIDQRFSYLYMDVGGGSTELSLINKNGIEFSRSFKIGTVRLLENKVSKAEWNIMEDWVVTNLKNRLPLSIIGSGGNINRVFKRSNNEYGHPLTYEYMKKEYKTLSEMELEDRIILEDLNEDRADVIVPALKIFLFVMEKANIPTVLVPKIGLVDGMVYSLYYELNQTHAI
ncbi:MAG: exopolyphosphatase [Chitinophagales bacterium]|jgi:exopolyphosphatase/guanosine-5'-triphosphate,3'-diphosphate pyrophosphatase|nr:exopolyphosphatase [Chitinophagales bacterium]